jgi:putative sigma-54 modulation protein
MEITVVGRNIAVTDALRAYAEKKVDKLQKYFEREIVDAQVTMAVERGIHTADVTIQVDGLLLRGEERTGDMYASIDGAVDKIERQIRKHKTRINRKLRQDGNRLVESSFGLVSAAPIELPIFMAISSQAIAMRAPADHARESTYAIVLTSEEMMASRILSAEST